MQKKRHLLSTVIAVAAWGVASEAPAIGWARAQQSAVLGAALDFSAALRLDPGDSVAPECVRAEVMVGEQRLPSFAVQLLLDTATPELLGIRVTTSNAIDEPVVAVTLAIGCPARMSRRFVLLADPPSLVATASQTPVELPALRSAAAPQAVEEIPASPARAPLASPPPPAPPPRPSTAPRKARRAVLPAAVAAAASRPAESGGARLRLDPADPPPSNGVSAAAAASAVEEAIQVVTQAANAARAAASAASAAEDRVAAIERQMAQLRAEADASRDQVQQLRGRLALAESADRWMTPLLGAVALLAALVGWLAWRLRSVQQERQRSWRAAANVAAAAERPPTPTSQLPMVTSEIMAPPPYATRPAAMAALSATPAGAPRPAQAPESAVERTQVLPPRGDAGAARDVTIEELLDLEQQAEFFIVLGQDDAAVDLLVDHLRDTGGGSPLPYLKLLEIYRRRDDRDAYERTRTRFNHRFNAYAPDWENDLQHGRSLEDYAGVIPRLQQVWPRPLDAMAELEALLFRKSRGQLFDLPAYREVLFLYSLARDLLDREAVDNGNVDLLLPLADGGEFSATAPHPYLTIEGESVFDNLAPETLPPTSPVDLDLSQPDEPSVIVKPLSPRR